MDTFLQPVILSGGSGTRLWPLSRGSYPKQFLPLYGSESLLAATIRRFHQPENLRAGIRVSPPRVVCNEAHRFLVAEQLRLTGFEPQEILLEPFAKNTAPALTLAALSALADHRDPVLVVLPSDHLIQNEIRFLELILEGAELARNGHVMTFGIIPTRAETGFGYIRKGAAQGEAAFELVQFIEKPGPEKARELVQSGNDLWNSGIFMMKASVWIQQVKNHCPAILASCEESLVKGRRDGVFYRVDPEAFESCPNLSIDHAVMEKIVEAKRDSVALVIPMDVGWSDLGSWAAVLEAKAHDQHGNVAQGDVFIKDTRNSLLYARSRLLAAIGVDDLIVVETKDAVLVAHKNCAQDIKSITDYLKNAKRPEHEFHPQVHRPWGNYESIDGGPRYQVKRLTVKPGASLSLQMHHHRAEHWIVVSGTARVTRGDETFLLSENESTYIPLGVTHRLENPGAITLEIIEVQSGSYLGEDDIVRFEDLYNRVESRAKH